MSKASSEHTSSEEFRTLVEKFNELVGHPVSALFDTEKILESLCKDLADYLLPEESEMSPFQNSAEKLNSLLDKLDGTLYIIPSISFGEKPISASIKKVRALPELGMWAAYTAICDGLAWHDNRNGIRLNLSGYEMAMIRFICTTKGLPYFLRAVCHNTEKRRPMELYGEADIFNRNLLGIKKGCDNAIIEKFLKLEEKSGRKGLMAPSVHKIERSRLQLDTYMLLVSLQMYSQVLERQLLSWSKNNSITLEEKAKVYSLIELHMTARTIFNYSKSGGYGKLERDCGRAFPFMKAHGLSYSIRVDQVLDMLYEEDEDKMQDMVDERLVSRNRRDLDRFTLQEDIRINQGRLARIYKIDTSLEAEELKKLINREAKKILDQDIYAFQADFLKLKPEELHISYS